MTATTDLDFDGALAALLGLVGTWVLVYVSNGDRADFDLVLSTGGMVMDAIPMGEGGDDSLLLRFASGPVVMMERPIFEAAKAHADGALTIRLAGIDVTLAPVR